MNSIDAFQAHLMSCMRNDSCATDGLKRLGINASEVAEAEEMVARAGLFYETEESVCLVDAYYRFLGSPMRIDPVEGSVYFTAKLFYSLPMWPGLELELTFNQDRFAGGIRFVRAGEPKARRLKLEDLIPWRVVEDDLQSTCREAVVVDGFSTTNDFCCTLLDPGSAKYLLAFDFGLLQEVLPWNDLNL